MSIVAGQTALAKDVLAVPTITLQHISTDQALTASSDQEARWSINSNTQFYVETPGKVLQFRDLTTDWASAATIKGVVLLGLYAYVLVSDASNNYRVYRYLLTDVTSSPTQMTISGQAFSTTGGASVRMTSNGTDFFFNCKAGNSANTYVISRYTISGTTLTYVADITCGSTAGTHSGFAVDSSINIYGMSSVDQKIRKYNSSGTIQYTTAAYQDPTNQTMINYLGYFYLHYQPENRPRWERIFLT